MKEKFSRYLDALVKNAKYICPAVVLVAVAATVVIAMSVGGARREELDQIGETIPTPEAVTPAPEEAVDEEVALVTNQDPAVYSVIATYFNAVAVGQEEVLLDICDKVETKDMIRFLEQAKYIDHYPTLEVYTKPGYAPGDTIAYVYFKVIFTGKEAEYPGSQMLYISTAEDGSLYIVRGSAPPEVVDYVKKVSDQADVVELNNRVAVEFDQLMAQQPDLLTYLNDLNEEVNRVVGVELAKLETEAQVPQETQTPQEGGEGTEPAPDPTAPPVTGNEPVYAVASTTVNVRASDSEKAEKLGKVTAGTKVQVLEQMVNGWTKILYEKKEGYIMTKYLDVQENASNYAAIGMVRAKETVNVRSGASTDAAKLGSFVAGDTADLIAVEGEWSKIKFGTQVGYVKSEYVEQQ